jgi:transcriptional antiterminator NusG
MERIEGEKGWYVVNTYSGNENKVAENLTRRVETMKMEDFVYRIVVAEIEEPVLKDGIETERMKKRNIYPGYVFIEMIMSNDAWYMVRNTPGVTGFVGSSGGGAKPFPVPTEQIEPVLKRMGMIDASMYSRYQIGDLVKISQGAFEGTEGTIVNIDQEKGMVRVQATFFGRPMPVDVEFSSIEKV